MLRIVKPKLNIIALPVALGAVISQNHLLLIKRNFEPFVGLWGMPGGKIHFGEHLNQAIIREIFEECHIKTEWVKLCGVVTENLCFDKEKSMHYLLHICQLKSTSLAIKPSKEGEVQWYALANLPEIKHIMIPSDFVMLQKLVLTKPKKFYYRCEVVKNNNEYEIKSFQ